MSPIAGRAGFAVATAVFALIVVGALAIGTLSSATLERRAGSEALHQARAVMAAELGVEGAIAAWDRRWNGAFARGFGTTWTRSTPDGADLTLSVSRLLDELFLVTADAESGVARRQVARVVRLDVSDPNLPAVLVSADTMDVTALPHIEVADRSPAGWDCPAPGPPIAPFVVSDTSVLLRFGHFDWGQLVNAANTRLTQNAITVTPQFAGEECDTTSPINWGEPTRLNGGVCTGYFPVVYAPGDLIVDGGRGQGLLLVDGDLTLRGSFEFFGVVLVRGVLRAGQGGARITGTVSMAAQGPTGPEFGGLVIYFSRCVARKALLGIALPVPIAERSWYQVFDEQ